MLCPTLEKKLIEHASPTLAGLKTGSLFGWSCPDPRAMAGQLIRLNRRLKRRGVALTLLQVKGGRALVYVYRPGRLLSDLCSPQAGSLLRELGYENGPLSRTVGRLRKRIQAGNGFPHEIGLFLGYPFPDVEGFIRNGGRNCRCCGYWKVYGDERDAMKRFAQYKKCTAVYSRLFGLGRSLEQLTVAA